MVTVCTLNDLEPTLYVCLALTAIEVSGLTSAPLTTGRTASSPADVRVTEPCSLFHFRLMPSAVLTTDRGT
ncbi:hypothetical protein D3C76_1436990 [compost metagenome]